MTVLIVYSQLALSDSNGIKITAKSVMEIKGKSISSKNFLFIQAE
jgi:hypothetical protein